MLAAEPLPAPAGTVASTVCRVTVFLWLRVWGEHLTLAGPDGCLCTGLKEPDRPPEVGRGSRGPKETSGLPLHLPAWSASLSSPPPPPNALRPPPPAWLDSPSSLAGEQEGVGSFWNVSAELQGEAWQLEIVSSLLGD